MDQEATDELVDIESHTLIAHLVFGAPIVLVPEGHPTAVIGDQAAVGERNPVGVAAKVFEHGLGPSERRFDMDIPVEFHQGCQVGDKRLAFGERLMGSEER